MRSLVVLAALVCGAAAAGPLEGVRVLTPSARQYEKIEIAYAPERAPENPFDPNVAAVDAEITTPSGKLVRVPGFWFQGYRRELRGSDEALTAEGKPEWRVRFSSGEVGRHRVVLVVKDGAALRRSVAQSFEVTQGPSGGPLRISPRNRAYFEDAAGRTFFPIGQNLCMYERKEGTYYFDRLLVKLAEAGGNYVRLWQEYYVTPEQKIAVPDAGPFTGFPLETQATGLGRYDLAPAWRLDYVAELCERLGVRWQLTFEMVVWWERALPKWKRNPYNAENGGPCVNPQDYLTDAKARELVRRRLRYSVARWGWTANLLAWELWNEVDNMDGFTSEACANWHREMGAYLKQIDPWQHLVTTSWRDRETFALPEIDIVQGHSYFGPEFDAAEYAIEDTDHLMRGFGKPFFFGEQGIEGPVSVDPEGRHFHDCLWASSLSGAGGAGMYWWWHNYIEPFNLYHHYTGLSRFLRGVDFAARQWKPAAVSRPNVPVSVRVYGLVADDQALLWLHDPLRGPAVPAASVNVIGLGDGDYEIEWWDTAKGEIIRNDRGDVRHLRHFGYGLELKPPEFRGDIAARVMRVKLTARPLRVETQSARRR
ncbi:MAG: DUF5060 domain-containing protein [Acidobacteriota bacterium]